MPDAAIHPRPMIRVALTVRDRLAFVAVPAALLVAASTVLPAGPASLAMLSAGTAALVLCVVLWALAQRHLRRGGRLAVAVSSLIDGDPAPRLLVSPEGEVLRANAAAKQQYPGSALSVTAILRGGSADAGALQQRLMSRLSASPSATEDVVTRRGRLRVSVQDLGTAGTLWRLEDITPPDGRTTDSGSLPMLTVSGQGTVLFMNEALRRLTGRRVRNLSQVIEGGEASAGPARLSTEGGSVPCRVLPIDLPGGRTELYILPHEGEEGSAGLGALEDMPVPLLLLGAEGAVKASNRLARDVFGGSIAGGASLSGLVEGLGRSVSDWVEDALRGRASTMSEVLRVRRSDADTYVQVTLGRVDADWGSGLVAVLHDATELKTLEAQFVQSQKMQAIGQLAGGVAHDFNNLLTAISGHCDLLMLRHDPGDGDHADLAQINANANRAAALVRQLLAFSRKQTLSLETMDLRETLSDMTHLLNRLVGEKVTLDLSHDPELRPIRADPRQLEQVLMNLVVNARDALGEGGRIRVLTENMLLSEPLRRDRVEVPVGSYVSLRVIDQGCGIPPDKLSKIFEPFYTTKRQGEGTGLGLSTAYGIVKQTGGFIFADSEEGKGATFTLLFPAHARSLARTTPEPDAPGPDPAPRGDGVVLLVEDEAPVRAFASRALALRGYTVHEAESGEAALRFLEGGAGRIDLFVTDVIMPGMDGPTWVREALKDRPGTRVIFVSGYAEDALENAETIPNAVFLPKPFSLSELATTVQRQLS